VKILLDLTPQQIANELGPLNLPQYKAMQVYKWLIKGKTFDDMSDVDKTTRALLKEKYIDQPCVVVKEVVSKDGTRKFLLRLFDGNIIESVLMSYKYGNTVCVSTQAGCRMGCVFCASALSGLARNLSAGEILGQVIVANLVAECAKTAGSRGASAATGGLGKERSVTNVVLMGSGEPFDNYQNVVSFLKLANDKAGLNISLRNISLSTCGLVKEMKKFADEGLPVNLTISLHSPFDDKRAEIMPIAKKFKVNEVVGAARDYFNKTGRRVIFEYCLIEGKNDTQKDAEKLAELLRGMSAHVNLIRLNSVKECSIAATADKDAKQFLRLLEDRGVSVTMRRSMGADIGGACGQLRIKFGGQNTPASSDK